MIWLLLSCGWFETPVPHLTLPPPKGVVWASPELPIPWELRCESPDAWNECFVEVPAATRTMGAQRRDRGRPAFDAAAEDNEGPPRQASVATFRIQRQEVSAGDYAMCVRAGFCEPTVSGGYATYDDPTRQTHPINQVSAAQAERYCAWYGARLPTEAEWELAAAGPEGRRWPWGDARHCGVAPAGSGKGAEPMTDCALDGTVGAGQLRGRSPYGLLGMAGNVWEWTSSPYGDGARAIRGGGWTAETPEELRVTVRGGALPELALPDLGFRCVR